MLAYSFGEEEVDRYIMIFKKDSPPSEDELNALRNGQEWNDDVAKRLSEQVCVILLNYKHSTIDLPFKDLAVISFLETLP